MSKNRDRMVYKSGNEWANKRNDASKEPIMITRASLSAASSRHLATIARLISHGRT